MPRPDLQQSGLVFMGQLLLPCLPLGFYFSRKGNSQAEHTHTFLIRTCVSQSWFRAPHLYRRHWTHERDLEVTLQPPLTRTLGCINVYQEGWLLEPWGEARCTWVERHQVQCQLSTLIRPVAGTWLKTSRYNDTPEQNWSDLVRWKIKKAGQQLSVGKWGIIQVNLKICLSSDLHLSPYK